MICSIECEAQARGWATVGEQGAIVKQGVMAEGGLSMALCGSHLHAAERQGMKVKVFKGFIEPPIQPGGGDAE